MSPSAHPRRAALLLGLALGLLGFAAGLVLASRWLPEWRAGEPLDKAVFRQRYEELAARAGLALQPGRPRVYLSTSVTGAYDVFRPQGDHAAASLIAAKTGVRVEVFHGVRSPGEGPRGNLSIDFSLDGRPEMISWWDQRINLLRLPGPGEVVGIAERLGSLLLQPGESLGPRRLDFVGNATQILYPIRGSSPPEHLLIMAAEAVMAGRRPSPLRDATAGELEAFMGRLFTYIAGGLSAFVALLALFVGLVLKSRISTLNGGLLALLSLLSLPPVLTATTGWWFYSVVVAVALALWIFMLWSCGESLLRSTDPSFTTSLDALRTGRLGPRGGRALLLGVAFGAALAGLRLGLLALAEILPGVWPAGPSLGVPIHCGYGSPMAEGIALAAGVALALALAFRLLPRKWAPLAAALVTGALLAPLSMQPFAAQWTAGAAVAGLLVYVARRHGLTALLIASLVSSLLPAAAFTSRYLDWLPGSFAATALPPVAFVLLGWLALPRSAAAEIQRLSPPGFVRRLEEERRLKHEMDLLARMQRGLLPRTLPQLEGYELAARSVLANEAGGDLYDVLHDEEGYLWLAAGDVAGHGYSCAIAQAMTKAALASLIGRGRTPAEVLGRVDRVLRAAGARRNFTTLALLRLRAESGEAVLGNAAHPYPFLVANGEVEELVLPGMPLGQGPPRSYRDHAFQLTPGGALVFCSDGLFEAADAEGSQYGFERARSVLRVAASRNAGKILEALLADWRHHLRTAQPLDDTTVVVLKRLGERERR